MSIPLEGRGKIRSNNASVGGGVDPMSLSKEAPISPQIRETTAVICTAVIVLSVSGGRKTTRENQ